ncbi:MAG: ZIP family metal transporter [Treponema sp.]|nr:ZIP family metal transporter [Treponema sp.]
MLRVIIGILIPFIGTTLGSACVFLMRKSLSDRLYRALLGFTAGVMIAASVWSLLLPSINLSEHLNKLAFLPAVVGFFFGVIFLFILDRVTPHLHVAAKLPEGPASKLSRTMLLVIAVTLHNIPEGMAVGVVFSSVLNGNVAVSSAAALVLSIGIAIQNFPEGAIISIPLKAEGNTRFKSFAYGTLSGIVEPIAAVITLLITSVIASALPYLLSFAAGAMIYVVIEELIPEATKNDKADICTIGFTIGFAIMMILDVAMG